MPSTVRTVDGPSNLSGCRGTDGAERNDLPTEKVLKEERHEGEVVCLEKPLSGTALLLVGLEHWVRRLRWEGELLRRCKEGGHLALA